MWAVRHPKPVHWSKLSPDCSAWALVLGCQNQRHIEQHAQVMCGIEDVAEILIIDVIQENYERSTYGMSAPSAALWQMMKRGWITPHQITCALTYVENAEMSSRSRSASPETSTKACERARVWAEYLTEVCLVCNQRAALPPHQQHDWWGTHGWWLAECWNRNIISKAERMRAKAAERIQAAVRGWLVRCCRHH